ncbi:MAG: metallophosphoesterase family protein, partial [Elusimicrobiota bacterium]
CGDVVSYGPEPNECVEKVSSLKDIKIVMGNHDAACCGLKELSWFNENAQAAIIWTSKVLTEKNRNFLKNLPNIYREENFILSHGSPKDPINEYLFTKKQFEENIGYFNECLCFVGHTHIPVVYQYNVRAGSGEFYLVSDAYVLTIAEDYRYIINAGSVGQPRDFDVRASFAMYDSAEGKIYFHRIRYDIGKTQSKMAKQSLPPFLIERLGIGR